MTACALLADGEMHLHAGPPTGEAFRGLVRFCFIKKVGFGGNTRLVHKPSGGDLTMDQMFEAAQKVFGIEVDSLDVFTREAEHGDWLIEGDGVPSDFAEA